MFCINFQAVEPGLSEPGCDATAEELIDPYGADDSRPKVRVQILNLIENKATKSVGDYGSRVGSSDVTIIARAEEEIKRIHVYIQPCPETTTRSPDTTGKLSRSELGLNKTRQSTVYPGNDQYFPIAYNGRNSVEEASLVSKTDGAWACR